MKKNYLFTFLSVFVCLCAVKGQAPASIGDYRTIASGSWHSLSIWQTRTAANTWGAASVLPTSTNNVYIQAGHLVTVSSADAFCNGLNLFNNASAITISSTFNVIVNERIRAFTAPATPITDATDGGATPYTGTNIGGTGLNSMITTGAGATGLVKFVGASRNITNTNEWNSNGTGNNFEFALDATAIGALVTGIKGSSIIVSSGTVSAGSGAFISVGTSAASALTIKTGAKLISARGATGSPSNNVTIANLNSSGAPCTAILIENGGTLELTAATPYVSCTNFTNNGTVIYSGTAQSLMQPLSTGIAISQYDTLILSSSGTFTKTATTSINVSGQLNVSTAAITFDLAANDLLSVGTVSNIGTIKTKSVSAAPIPSGKTWGGTVDFYAINAGQKIPSGTYNNLTSSAAISGVFTAAGNLVVDGALSLTQNASVILDMSTFTLGGTLGTITNSGTIRTANTSAAPIPTGRTWTGTIQYNAAAGGQTISATQFNNLTVSNTSGTNTAAANVAVNGTLVTTAGGTTDLSTFTLSGTLPTVTSNGILKTSNTSALPIPTGKTWGGTVEYAVTAGGQTIVAGNYNNLILRNTSAANTLVNGGAIGISGVFTPGSFNNNVVTGNTVNFNNASGGQTIPAFNYNNLTVSNTSGNTTLAPSRSIGIAGVFTPGSGTFTVTGSTINFNSAAGGQTIPVFSYNNLFVTNTTTSSTLAGNVNVADTFAICGSKNLSTSATNRVIYNDPVLGTFLDSATAGTSIALTEQSPEWPSTSGPKNVVVNTGTLSFTPTAAGNLNTVSSYQLSSNVATFTSTGSLTFSPGDIVYVANVAPNDSVFDGTYTVLASPAPSAGTFSVALNNADVPFNNVGVSGNISKTPLIRRTITGTMRLNGGSFNIGTGNQLTMANGSTFRRSSGTGQMTVNSGLYTIGTAVTDTISVIIDAGTLVVGSSEMSSSPKPGGYGTLIVRPATTTYETSGGRRVVNFVNEGKTVLKPTATSTFYIYNRIFGTGTIQSGNNGASIVIGSVHPTLGSANPAWNTGDAGTLYFDQTTDGTTNAFNNFRVERAAPAANGSVTFANSVSFRGNYNQSSGIVNLASGATLTLSGTASSSTAFLRGNSAANVTITGSGTFGSLYFDQTNSGVTNVFNNFTLNRTANGVIPGTATLGNSIKVTGTTNLTNGSLKIGSADTLEIAGNFINNSGSGTIAGAADNTTSSLPYLTISGSGATFNPLKFTTGFTEFKNFVTSRSLSIDATPGNGLRIQSNLNLDGASTTLTTNDNVTLRSTAAGTARVLSVSGITNPFVGNFAVERYIPANANRAWRLISIPVNTTQTINTVLQNGQASGVAGPSGAGVWLTNRLSTAVANGYDGQTTNNHTLLTYNSATGSWEGVTTPTASTGIGTDGGFMLFVRGDRTANSISSTITPTTITTRGTLKTGNYPPAPITVNADKYALVGNPYASAIDLRQIIRTGGTQAVFYVWDPKLTGTQGLGAYQTLTYNGTNYVITPGGGSYGSSSSVMDTVQSGMAFLARAVGASGTLQFTEACKIAGTRSSVFRPANPVAEKRLITNLYAVNGNQTDLLDGSMMLFEEMFADQVDGDDAKKLVNFGENLGLLRSGQILAVDKRSEAGETDTVRYSLSRLKIKSYQLQIIAENLQQPHMLAKLADSWLGTETPVELNGRTAYPFAVTADSGSYASGRFKLILYQRGDVRANTLKFRAEPQNTQVRVSWEMANQINVKEFVLEKSSDGQNFCFAATVAALQGNGSTFSYGWTDANAVRGDIFYRLRIVGKNGQSGYSPVVKLSLGRNGSGIMLFPTIVSDNTIRLQFTGEGGGNYRLNLFDGAGQKIMSKTIPHTSGSALHTIKLDRPTGKGSYRLQVIRPDDSVVILPLMVSD